MSEWISVNDALPKKLNHIRTATVLVSCLGQPNMPVFMAYATMVDGVNYPYKVKRWHSLVGEDDIVYGNITHWMPMPEPPTDKQPQS